MVFKYCFGMIMSVSTLMIFRGAATPSSVVNFSISALPGRNCRKKAVYGPLSIVIGAAFKGIKCADLSRGGLNRLHIGVGEAEMVADLVDQHVADDVAKRLFVLGPIAQDRTAVQPDHVGQAGDVAVALLRQTDALKQAKQVELALRLQLVEDFVSREIVDADDDPLAELAESVRQALENFLRHR